eukprot:scaffold14369_cov19-Tisochrysis_lutea.AAC.4
MGPSAAASAAAAATMLPSLQVRDEVWGTGSAAACLPCLCMIQSSSIKHLSSHNGAVTAFGVW